MAMLIYKITAFYCILQLVGNGKIGVLVIKSAVITKTQRCKLQGMLNAVIPWP